MDSSEDTTQVSLPFGTELFVSLFLAHHIQKMNSLLQLPVS